MLKLLASAVSGLVVLVFAVVTSAQPAVQAFKGPEDDPRFKNPERIVPDEFIVVFKREVRQQLRVEQDESDRPKTNLPSISAAIEKSKAKQFERQFPTAKAYPAGSRYPDLTGHYLVKIEEGASLDEAMTAFASDPNVDHVEKIGVHETYAVPNDSFYAADQWNMRTPFGINAQSAWDTEDGDPSVIVAVLDTGVRYFHVDLGGPNAVWSPATPQTNGNIFVNPGEIPNNGIDDDGNGRVDDTVGYDFLASGTASGCVCIDNDCNTIDNDPDDFNGHGTHVAGIAGAMTNNTRGVAGTAGGFSAGPAGSSGNGIKILSLRVGWHANCGGNITGIISMAAAASAMNYVANLVDAGHNVVAVNCSWGSSNTGGLDAAVNAVLARDVMVVKAAGNSNSSTPDFLGAKAGVVVVGGTASDGTGYTSSNHGPWVDIAAPGVSIRSTVRNSADANPNNHYYAIFTGTSMSAPHIAGVAALLESCRPSLTSQDKLDIMQRTSIPYNDVRDLGDGIVNAANSVVECLRDQKVVQRPSNDGEMLPSNVDADDLAPNVVLADDFVSDGRPITGARWWGSPLGPFVDEYRIDDGVQDNSIGLTGGGDVIWLNQFTVLPGLETITTVNIAYGTVPNGTAVTILLYSDPNNDGDPTDGVLLATAATNVANANTNIFNLVDVPDTVVGTAGDSFFVGAYITHGASQFPAAVDQSSQNGRSWVAGDDPGMGDINNLGNNGLPPTLLDSIPNLGGNWLLRADAGPVGGAPADPDGWYLSFHEPLSTGGSAEEPLGLYFCDQSVVDIFNTSIGSCDGRPTLEYTVDLSDCCLVQANTDSRNGETPATASAFLETECFTYAFSVAAVGGHRYEDLGSGCEEIDTAWAGEPDHFWGWKSTSNEIGVLYGLQDAFETSISVPGTDWLFGPWSTASSFCTPPNLAFALYTTTSVGLNNDLNQTGVPDVCECIPPLPVIDEPSPVAKNRYLSFEPQAGGIDTAIRVTITSSTTFPGMVGQSYWVGPHGTCLNCTGSSFTEASLQCSQHCQDWGGVGVVHAHGADVVPGTTYDIQVIDCSCDPGDPLNYSAALALTTQKWGDVTPPFGGGSQPNFADISAVVSTFSCVGLLLPKVQAQLQPNVPNTCGNISFADVNATVLAFAGGGYPYAGPTICP